MPGGVVKRIETPGTSSIASRHRVLAGLGFRDHRARKRGVLLVHGVGGLELGERVLPRDLELEAQPRRVREARTEHTLPLLKRGDGHREPPMTIWFASSRS